MDGASVDARLEHVTLYASGARVRRVTKLEGPIPVRVRIAGLPLSVIDDTVRIEIEGPAIATTVRTGVDVPVTTAATEDPPELAAGKREVALADAEVERLRGALERTSNAPIVEDDPSEETPATWAAIVAARRAVIAVRAERELALRQQLVVASRAADEARRSLQAALDREHRTGTAKPAKEHELRKFVDVELATSSDGAITLRLEYLVGAARWAPSYVARLDADKVTMEMRAVVAQATGEDWAGVPLALSTAEPTRFALLPELHAQRIGRRQQPPSRAGFRAAPAGADQLYADYDRERTPQRPTGESKPKPFSDRSVLEDSTYEGRAPMEAEMEPSPDYGGSVDSLEQEVWDDDSSAAKEAFKTPMSGYAMPANYAQTTPAPPPAQAAVPRGGMALAKGGKRRSGAVREEANADGFGRMVGGQAGGGPADLTRAPHGPPAPRLDYGSLVMAPPTSPRRGMLVMATPDRAAGEAERDAGAAQARIRALTLPRGCRADWAHSYDYAYATDGAVDVRADGAWHSIAVTAHGSTAKLRHVAVPREQSDVFRVAAIANPFAGPLLPGPIDVYDRGRFLVTSEVDYTPPGASVEVGLGVDATVKLARNTEFREEATGMLRGQLRLHHAVTVDIENLSGRPIDLEVRERIPVTREGDDDIEVTLGKVDPPWERWTPDPDAPKDQRLRGAYRWRVALPAAQKKTLRAAYEVKIAGKLELVGGNRRES
ncbi:MAG TPA: DUF4139 domain-containing protein [Kofleriaceae bacterium]